MNTLTRLISRRGFSTSIARHNLHAQTQKGKPVLNRALLWGSVAGVTLAGYSAFSPKVHLDTAPKAEDADTTIDPATSIAFPNVITVPSKVKIPPMTLVGVGVRTVSFLGIKVYSVGFYADLANPNLKLTDDMSPAQKVEHIIQNTGCVVRIVPTRSTSYSHMRDAFMRALQARLVQAKKDGTLTEEQAQEVGFPMRKLKSIFPNSPLAKHTPLDIYLSAPSPDKPRALVFRDLGAIEDTWVATELVLHYFNEAAPPSPPLKEATFKRLESFQK